MKKKKKRSLLVSFIPVHIPVESPNRGMGKTDELCAFDWLNRAGRGNVGHSGAGLGGRQGFTVLSQCSPRAGRRGVLFHTGLFGRGLLCIFAWVSTLINL